MSWFVSGFASGVISLIGIVAVILDEFFGGPDGHNGAG